MFLFAVVLFAASDSLPAYELPPVRVEAEVWRPPTNQLHPWDVLSPGVTDRLLEAQSAEAFVIPRGAGMARALREPGECLTGSRLDHLVTALLDQDNYMWGPVYMIQSLDPEKRPPVFGIRFSTMRGPVEVRCVPGFLSLWFVEPARIELPGMFNPSVLLDLAAEQFPEHEWPREGLKDWDREVRASKTPN